MKCITIHQPWATLLIAGRTSYLIMPYATRFKGTLAIHAASSFPRENIFQCRNEWMEGFLKELGFDYVFQIPLGAVLGTVELVDSIQLTNRNSAGLPLDDPVARCHRLKPGDWAWVCARPKPWPKPIPLIGKQVMFDIPDDYMNRTNIAPRPVRKKSHIDKPGRLLTDRPKKVYRFYR